MVKGQVHSITCHEGPEEEKMYRSTHSLTSALGRVGGQRHAPAALRPGKTRYPSYRWLRGPQGLTGGVQKVSPPIGILFPERPTRCESLYRLSYPGPEYAVVTGYKQCSYRHTILLFDEFWNKKFLDKISSNLNNLDRRSIRGRTRSRPAYNNLWLQMKSKHAEPKQRDVILIFFF